jgi:ankyrin repeat protein
MRRAARVRDSSGPEAVLESAGQIDARDSEGRTALMLAVLQGRLDSVLALLRRGADPNAADLAGLTPLQAARANQQAEIADALLRAGAR